MATQLITKELLKTLKPKSGVYDIRDSELKGFMVRVTPAGGMSYAAQYTRGKRFTLGDVNKFDSPTQARKKAKKIIADYQFDQLDPSEELKRKQGSNVTFKQFLNNEYVAHISTHHKSSSRETVQRIEKHFKEFFPKRLQEISSENILKWRGRVINAGTIKHNTINRTLAKVRALFKLAMQFGYIEQNPVAALKPLKYPDERVRYLSKAETKLLHDALNERDERLKKARISANEHRQARGYELFPEKKFFGDQLKPAVIITLNTGLRKNELFSLEKSALDFEANSIHLKDSKSRKKRNIPMNKIVVETLKQWLEQNAHISSPYVFPSASNPATYNRDANKAWNTLLGKSTNQEALIEDFHWHDLRHDFASRLVMANVDINTVRALLGHSDIKMTLRYAHLGPDHLQNSVARLVME